MRLLRAAGEVEYRILTLSDRQLGGTKMRRTQGIVLAAGLACLVSACAMTPQANRVPASAMGVFEATLSGRELAGPQTYLGPIPTAVVVLKKDQDSRNAAFCQGYSTLPTMEELSNGAITAANAVPLRWLLSTEPEAPVTGCAALLAGYDYDRATALAAELAKRDEAPSFAGAGPFIVEFMPDGSALVIDTSNRSTPSLRQVAPQWLLLNGTTLPADSPSRGCLLAAAAMNGTMAQKASAWQECEFPNGFDKQVIRIAGCAATQMIGGWIHVGASLFCKNED